MGLSYRPRRRADDAAELEGLAHCVRLERLGQRLEAHGPLAVRDSRVRRGGNRIALVLDDGSVLALRLFWPRRGAVAAVESVHYDDRIGWVVVVRTAAGERRVDYAWIATLDPGEPIRRRARNGA